MSAYSLHIHLQKPFKVMLIAFVTTNALEPGYLQKHLFQEWTGILKQPWSCFTAMDVGLLDKAILLVIAT